MNKTTFVKNGPEFGRLKFTSWLLIVSIVLIIVTFGTAFAQLDICGCQGNPNSLGDFNSADDATWPTGTEISGVTITIPLPNDGITLFDSFTVDKLSTGSNAIVKFKIQDGAPNVPVKLLVKGDVFLAQSNTISVDGDAGERGNTQTGGLGGNGGPGGFRGGDGAYQQVNQAANGGYGLGPGGGKGGTSDPLANGEPGVFFSADDLRPLVGGSGGGGGASSSQDANCSGGGGGGGGGAILIASNGTVTINGQITARGGTFGSYSIGSCASSGGSGSAGAIHVVANQISGSGSLSASGTSPGKIRMEALVNDFTGSSSPLAVRSDSPGPLVNPLMPRVAITKVNGEAVPDVLRGNFGEVDVVVSTPGAVVFDIETDGVPSETLVQVTVKPRLDGEPFVVEALLESSNCNGAGGCFTSAVADLIAGSYFVEARATFTVP